MIKYCSNCMHFVQYYDKFTTYYEVEYGLCCAENRAVECKSRCKKWREKLPEKLTIEKLDVAAEDLKALLKIYEQLNIL